MNNLDKLTIKSLENRLENNKPCAYITISSNDLEKCLKIIKKQENMIIKLKV